MPTKANTTFCKVWFMLSLAKKTKNVCPKNSIDKNHFVPLLFLNSLLSKKIAKATPNPTTHHKKTTMPKKQLLIKNASDEVATPTPQNIVAT